jgi:hypothetical protein
VVKETNFTADVDAILSRRDAAHENRVSRQSEQPDRHLHSVLRGQAAACRACARISCWCSMRPMPNTSAQRLFLRGIELVAPSENVVMARTFSKIHGLAGLRIGWGYMPAACADALNRIRGPFNLSAPAIAAGVGSDRGQRAYGSGAGP